MRIVIEERQISEIPVLNIYDEQAVSRLPIILMLHGFTSCKENNLKDAYFLAKKGYYLILFDARLHGERENIEFKEKSFYEKARSLVEIEVNSCREIYQILDHRDQFMPGDPERIGLIGFSMGANTIFKFLTGKIPLQVKAAVTLVATPYWAKSIHKYMQSRPDLEGFFTPEEFAEIETVEPSGDLNKITDFPLLMLNGVKDDRVPITDIRRVYHQLRKQYHNKEQIKLIEYPELGHQVVKEMIEHAADWFTRYLI